jgi:hypothetical protein
MADEDIPMKSSLSIAGAAVVLLTAGLRADFSYEQSTKVTGGAMAGMMRMAGAMNKQARMAGKSQVLVKGGRMAHLNGDTGQIIDLSAETITDMNFAKKTYSVITFAQMTEAMKKMAERMHQDPESDVDFQIDVKDTGASKEIRGLNTHQMLMTLTGIAKDKKTGREGEMKIVSDLWLTKDVKGYDEVRKFYQQMAQKMAFMPGAGAGMMQPGMMKGMSEVWKQAAKLEGVPVVQIVRIGDGPQVTDTSGNTTQAAPAPSAGDAAAGAIAGRLGRLGGLGGLGRKKKQQDDTPPASQDQQSSPGSLIEMTTELASFSSALVDASKLEVPAGFRKVESEMLKTVD